VSDRSGWRWRQHIGCTSPGECRHDPEHRAGRLQHWPAFTIAAYPRLAHDRQTGQLEVVIVGPAYPGRPGGQLTERYSIRGGTSDAALRRLTAVGDARQAAYERRRLLHSPT